MNLRKIILDEDLLIYKENFLKRYFESGNNNTVEITLGFLRKSNVFALYNESEEMIAGFSLNTTLPLRLPQFNHEKDYNDLPKNFSWDDCCEMIFFWKKKGFKNKEVLYSIYWKNIFQEFFNTEKKFLLGQSSSKKLGKYYSLLNPIIISDKKSIHGVNSLLFSYPKQKISLIYCYLNLLRFQIYLKKLFSFKRSSPELDQIPIR